MPPNVGCAAAPVVGPEKTVLAVCVFNVSVSALVPAVLNIGAVLASVSDTLCSAVAASAILVLSLAEISTVGATVGVPPMTM